MKHITLIALLLFVTSLKATDNKQLKATRINEAPKIDGVLNEPEWQQAAIGSDFVQYSPNPGLISSQKTEVKIVYDNAALYIGATLYDTASDSILCEVCKRDDAGANTDIFAVLIDTYNDDINAFEFLITSSGVQIDGKSSSEGEDIEWNAVWESKVNITDKGWVVELKIPYSALRFADVAEQTWGINFIRKIRRIREESSWKDKTKINV